MTNQHSTPRLVLLALPGLVLLGYGLFITRMYWPYLNGHLRLRSPELASLPEDVIGFGFWMWWPFIALLLSLFLVLALFLSGTQRRLKVGISFLGIFALLSIADYFLCQRLVQELIRHGYVAACKADSPPGTVTYSNDDALPGCDRLDDKANELGRKAALELFSAESGVQSKRWELSRASRCEGRILVRIMVGDGSTKLPFFVQMDESFSNKVLQRPE